MKIVNKQLDDLFRCIVLEEICDDTKSAMHNIFIKHDAIKEEEYFIDVKCIATFCDDKELQLINLTVVFDVWGEDGCMLEYNYNDRYFDSLHTELVKDINNYLNDESI